ncbi:hypothetical protein OGAPHI_001857 [Ogataea philodendri]|uniref:Uncharacterized protein n=1 Tax=Ogataea philodendri TaxID=1378263 RepID=A0A9P8T6H7_9ASCO|nr:uncharacterized protein OGAPHI_001857 [Ogataea philodendri]KAH3668103.1 hypothetical protein OGAPHI_001857 [Ogataea philodendri]
MSLSFGTHFFPNSTSCGSTSSSWFERSSSSSLWSKKSPLPALGSSSHSSYSSRPSPISAAESLNLALITPLAPFCTSPPNVSQTSQIFPTETSLAPPSPSSASSISTSSLLRPLKKPSRLCVASTIACTYRFEYFFFSATSWEHRLTSSTSVRMSASTSTKQAWTGWAAGRCAGAGGPWLLWARKSDNHGALVGNSHCEGRQIDAASGAGDECVCCGGVQGICEGGGARGAGGSSGGSRAGGGGGVGVASRAEGGAGFRGCAGRFRLTGGQRALGDRCALRGSRCALGARSRASCGGSHGGALGAGEAGEAGAGSFRAGTARTGAAGAARWLVAVALETSLALLAKSEVLPLDVSLHDGTANALRKLRVKINAALGGQHNTIEQVSIELIVSVVNACGVAGVDQVAVWNVGKQWRNVAVGAHSRSIASKEDRSLVQSKVNKVLNGLG